MTEFPPEGGSYKGKPERKLNAPFKRRSAAAA
jgi:hypothetical protein